MCRCQAKRRGDVNHHQAGAGLDDHFRKSRVVMVGEVCRASRAGGTTGVGVVPLIHCRLTGGGGNSRIISGGCAERKIEHRLFPHLTRACRGVIFQTEGHQEVTIPVSPRHR